MAPVSTAYMSTPEYYLDFYSEIVELLTAIWTFLLKLWTFYSKGGSSERRLPTGLYFIGWPQPKFSYQFTEKKKIFYGGYKSMG